jgi:DNA-binding NtrC family response regulator
MARLGSYDAVLVDIRLPDLNGYEAFHKLRTIRPDLEVVFMSGFGYDPGHSIVKARQEGLRSVLYKPFRVDQLLDALAKAPRPNAPAAPEPGRA